MPSSKSPSGYLNSSIISIQIPSAVYKYEFELLSITYSLLISPYRRDPEATNDVIGYLYKLSDSYHIVHADQPVGHDKLSVMTNLIHFAEELQHTSVLIIP